MKIFRRSQILVRPKLSSWKRTRIWLFFKVGLKEMSHIKTTSSSYGFDMFIKYIRVKDNRTLIKSCKTELPSPPPSPPSKKLKVTREKRWYGSFLCTCGRSWSSGYTWTLDDVPQPMQCQNCMTSVLPHKRVSLNSVQNWFSRLHTVYINWKFYL